MIPLVLAVSTRLQSTLTDVPDNSEGVVEQAQDAETESEEEQETQPSKRNRDGAVFQEVLDGITVSGTSSAEPRTAVPCTSATLQRRLSGRTITTQPLGRHRTDGTL
jgi:hypothetical protein